MKRELFILLLLVLLVGCNKVEETTLVHNETQENVVVESGDEVAITPPVVEAIKSACPFECCIDTDYKKKLCDADEYCDNNICKKYQCMENTGCNANEQCSDYSCVGLSCGACEYTENHQCLPYQCCENTDCSEGECINHVCEVLYKFDLGNVPQSIEQNLLDQQLKAARNALEKNGYGAASEYCRIDNGTYSVEFIKQCDAELIDFNVNEGQVYHTLSLKTSNTSGNYDYKIINAFLILYSKMYADYYTVKIGEMYHDKIDTNFYKIAFKGKTSTVARDDLEEFAYGEITKEEFLSRVLKKN